MTNNSCLAESICNQNSPCNIKATNINTEVNCLRSADFESDTKTNHDTYIHNKYMKYKTCSYDKSLCSSNGIGCKAGEAGAHCKGQLISGLLWEIRSESSINADTFDKTVYKSLNFLNKSKSNYYDFMKALLKQIKN